ncbi:MAG: acylphosphatase [Proteobacteria bacterium]|nr:acylphosphatase [Pseudomonadota bacterium]
MQAEPISRHLRIEGRVQGVFYRASLIDEARRLGLTGWVRNRLDGSVEAVAQGAPEAVQALIDWAQRGPPRAQVSAVRVSPAPAQAGAGFEQRDTA